jgi:hypothetical protein
MHVNSSDKAIGPQGRGSIGPNSSIRLFHPPPRNLTKYGLILLKKNSGPDGTRDAKNAF